MTVKLERVKIQWVWALLLGGSVLYAVVMLCLFPKWTVDDTYIYFRYAENLALDGQLTWNVGEDPIEGYTGVALPVILAALLKLGVPLHLSSKIIGLVSYFGTGILLILIMRLIGLNIASISLISSLFFTAPFLYTHAWSGLETCLFMAGILLALFALIRCLTDAHVGKFANEALLFISLLVVSLTRPEGALLAILSTLTYFAVVLRRKGIKRVPVSLFRLCLFFILPGVTYFVWRWKYYGYLLPNTFYVKALWTGDSKAVESLIQFFWRYLALSLLGACMSVYIGCKIVFHILAQEQHQKANNSDSNIVHLNLVLIVVGLFTAIVIGNYLRWHLWMNYSFRFFAPFFPLFLLLIGLVFDTGIRAINLLESKIFPSAIATILILIGVVMVQFCLNVYFLPEERTLTSDYKRLMEEVHIKAGKYLRQTVPSNEYLSVYIDAGAIPYFSQLPTIDLGRLNSEILAHDPLKLVPYFFRLLPGAAVFTSHRADRLEYTPEAERIFYDKRFANYELVKILGTNAHSYRSYWEFIFLRKDLYSEMRESLQELITIPNLKGAVLAIDFNDANSVDRSGFRNHGTLVGSPSFVPCASGKAMMLRSALQQYIEVPDGQSLNITGPITILALIRPSRFPNAQPRIVSRMRNYEHGYDLSLTQSGKLYFTVGYGHGYIGLSSKRPISSDHWYFVAATLDDSLMRIYMDGRLDSQCPSEGFPASNAANLRIGQSFGGGDRYYDGLIHFVAIYKQSLSPARIKEIYEDIQIALVRETIKNLRDDR